MNQRKPLGKRITTRIRRSKKEVFLRKDFSDLGGYDQVGRTLKRLTEEKQLIRIGQGLYAKARVSPLSGKAIPRIGIKELTTEALQRLNVETVPSSYERAYNEGETTQVPTGRVIGVKCRISRKIGYNGKFVKFEHV
ncbi:DUF6088 family protein [Picosynechococcus sp. PCC 73109]|uniref:DUF6088 family protein n=1 Tax=Picosynechococcus sp. PCC 73109 TaxID=374982 RepID=UPI0007457F2A|nr:DUF6088 family protein [Picosynechococcus sp. PCC 73109]AMA10663.1 hypothetical protein AWQ23_14540 [Picosynechococcus sp. PCC 73109]